ncbi:hypothetical protein Dimus_037601, partial [Dionaea muscipula]
MTHAASSSSTASRHRPDTDLDPRLRRVADHGPRTTRRTSLAFLHHSRRAARTTRHQFASSPAPRSTATGSERKRTPNRTYHDRRGRAGQKEDDGHRLRPSSPRPPVSSRHLTHHAAPSPDLATDHHDK